MGRLPEAIEQLVRFDWKFGIKMADWKNGSLASTIAPGDRHHGAGSSAWRLEPPLHFRVAQAEILVETGHGCRWLVRKFKPGGVKHGVEFQLVKRQVERPITKGLFVERMQMSVRRGRPPRCR